MRHVVRSVAALACAAAFSTAATAQTTTLKMQATWPASLTLYENFTYFADRISKVSGGTMKIDAMPAGQVACILRLTFCARAAVLNAAAQMSAAVERAMCLMSPPLRFR